MEEGERRNCDARPSLDKTNRQAGQNNNIDEMIKGKRADWISPEKDGMTEKGQADDEQKDSRPGSERPSFLSFMAAEEGLAMDSSGRACRWATQPTGGSGPCCDGIRERARGSV